MVTKKSEHCNYDWFLNEICSLRKQKSKYLSVAFCTQLEKLSRKITEKITQHFGFGCAIYDQWQQPPEKLSDEVVNLYLEHMSLSKLNVMQRKVKNQIGSSMI